jgi:3-oxoacyl-[acyl-carrier protein] reductase
MDLDLDGARAVLTGGTRGIGQVIAQRLAHEGVTVTLCSRDGTQARAAAEAIGGFGIQADVTRDDELAHLVATAARQMGGIDIVIASAGGASGGRHLDDTSPDDWRRTFDINVVHPVSVVRAAIPYLEQSPRAAALMVSSISGSRPQLRAQYAAAKAAESHAAAALGRELGPRGIRVNAISPGSILVPGGSWDRRRKDDPTAFAEWIADELPFGRLGTPQEVADVVAFLVSPRATWIAGTNVVVDGAQGRPTMR